MKFISSLTSQIGKYWLVLIITISTGALLLLLTFEYAINKGITPSNLTRDTATVLNGPAFTGALSNLGILLWSATSAIMLFSAYHLYKNTVQRRAALMTFLFGVLTAILCLDDTYQFHEKAFSGILYVPEEVIYLFYLICITIISTVCRTVVVTTPYIIGLIAMLFFGMSILIDELNLPSGNHDAFIEDSFKFVGIALWTVYHYRSAFGFISDVSWRKENFNKE
ncbi:MAG: hypothetical protein ACK5B3_03140 [Bacteroidota bacterium]|jgi:hypothetical protein